MEMPPAAGAGRTTLGGEQPQEKRAAPEGGLPRNGRRSMIRVVVADDEALVRSGLAVLLKHEPGFEVVGSAATGSAPSGWRGSSVRTSC